MAENTPIISFRDADILNGEATVIYGLNMDVYPGDFVYIVGKVGTGKTSIIRTIIAENDLEKGYGAACGFELNGIAEKQIPHLRRQMGVVFQNFELLMDRSVEDNLRFVLEATGWKDKEKIAARITEVLDAVGMGRKARCRSSSPVANSSASLSQGHYSMNLRSSSPTSLPETLTTRPLTASCSFSQKSTTRRAQP